MEPIMTWNILIRYLINIRIVLIESIMTYNVSIAAQGRALEDRSKDLSHPMRRVACRG